MKQCSFCFLCGYDKCFLSSFYESKVIIIGELTVPREDNIDERNEYKRVSAIKSHGWSVYM